MLNYIAIEAMGNRMSRLVSQSEPPKEFWGHNDASCAAVHKSSYPLHLASWSRIWTSWTMCVESGVSMPQTYWLNMWALRLSKTILGHNDIQCGWTSSKVAINTCVAAACIPRSISSNLSRWARYRARYTSVCVAAYRTIVGVWRGVLRHWCRVFVVTTVRASRWVSIVGIPEIDGLSLRISSKLSLLIVDDAPP